MIKSGYFTLISLVLLVSCSGGIDQESAQEAVEALQTVDATVSVGTNMVNYRQALIPAKTEVDQYLAQESESEFAQNLSRAMSGHQVAADWWQCNITQSANSSETQWTAQARCRDTLLPTVFALYPETEEKVETAVAERQQKIERILDYKSEALDPDAILQYIWQQTSADTAAAATMISH